MDVEIPRDFLAQPNDQAECSLVRLPREVRHTIYELCFMRQRVSGGNYVLGVGEGNLSVGSDESPTHDTDEDIPLFDRSLPNWLRPGCTTRMRINTALLRTCQSVHNEASPILLSTTVHKCYQGYGPGVGPSLYFERLTKMQLSHVRRVHLFTQVGDFDCDGLWLRTQLQPVAQSLQHLTVTFRDLGGAPKTTMLLNPFQQNVAKRQAVDEFIEKTKRSREPEMPETGWAGTFADMPALKTLTMELEDHEGKKNDLEALALWAKTWNFPLGGGQFMSSNTAPVSSVWRRPRRHHHHSRHQSYTPPQIITWTIQWDAPPSRIATNRVLNKQGSSTGTTNESRIPRPAYDPCLGGLNSIFSGASDENIRALIEWGVL